MKRNPLRVVVVGGGVMGLSCAWRLARRGARVMVIEARRCGEGATLAALGALWPASALVQRETQRMHRESLWEFETFVRELEACAAGSVGFKRLGRMEILESAKSAERAREEARVACAEWPVIGEGAVMEFLEAEQVENFQSGLVEAPYGALMCRVTAQVDVSTLVAALKRSCEVAGVVIREMTRVLDWVERGGRVVGVRLENEAIEVDGVVVTSGAWTQFLPRMEEAVVIRPVKGQGIAMPLPRDEAGNAVLKMIVKRGPIYLIPWEEKGEVLVGSTTEPEAKFDELPTEQAREFLRVRAGETVPALRGGEVLRQWAGLRPQNEAKGHAPVMGAVAGVENLYVCAGHYKTGIGMAPLASRLMAEMILGAGAQS